MISYFVIGKAGGMTGVGCGSVIITGGLTGSEQPVIINKAKKTQTAEILYHFLFIFPFPSTNYVLYL